MKTLVLILGTVVLFLGTAFCQAPPADVTVGMLIKTDGKTTFATQLGGNINIMSKETLPITAEGEPTVTSQIYIQPGVVFGDDVYLSADTKKELEGVTSFVVGEKFIGDFSLGSGIGVMANIKEGENDYKVPFMLKASYNLFNFVRIGVQGQYIPVQDAPDLIFTGVNLGINP